jgi:hypothetical protein
VRLSRQSGGPLQHALSFGMLRVRDGLQEVGIPAYPADIFRGASSFSADAARVRPSASSGLRRGRIWTRAGHFSQPQQPQRLRCSTRCPTGCYTATVGSVATVHMPPETLYCGGEVGQKRDSTLSSACR